MAAGDGLVTMTPTSINVTGTSGSINADGGVDFTAVTSLSLNGVFTSSCDNYLVVLRGKLDANDRAVGLKLRSAGTDTTGTDYTVQVLTANSTTVTGSRSTAALSLTIGTLSSTIEGGMTVHVYGPALAQPTAVRGVTVRGSNSAMVDDRASTHSLSTSYDGFTLFISADNMTGNVVVFGYEE